MGIIRDNVSITGTSQQVSLIALFDTGADYNVIRPRLSNGMTIDELGVFEYYPEYVPILMPGENEGLEARLYDYAVFKWIDIYKQRISFPGFVLMETGDDLLLGHGIMQQLGIRLDLENHCVIMP